MKKTVKETTLRIAALSLLAGAAFSPVQAEVARVSEPAGGFSYVPPSGWKVITFPGQKYHVCITQPVDKFAPNLNIQEDKVAMPMSKYAQLTISQLQQLSPGYHLFSQSAFVTQSGLRGYKIVYKRSETGHVLRNDLYLLPGHGDQKLAITVSIPASVGSKDDALVDASLKTFALN